MRSEKTLTTEIIISDPVYVATGLALSLNSTTATINDVENTVLTVVKDESSRRDDTSIKTDINNIFINYSFD